MAEIWFIKLRVIQIYFNKKSIENISKNSKSYIDNNKKK